MAKNTDTFAWRLRQHRDAMDITQFEMCDRIVEIIRREEPGFSMTYPAYNKIETGDTATPKHNVMRAIKKITGLSLDYLITGEEPEARGEPFNNEEANAVGALVDAMSPTNRRLLQTIAENIAALDKKQRAQDIALTRLLEDVSEHLSNGQRKLAADYIENIDPYRLTAH